MSESSGAQSSASATSQTSQAPQQQSPAQGTNSPAKYRVKVEGQEREVSLEDLTRDYQLREASNRRFQEASAKEKQLKPILEALEKGDFKSLLGPKAKSAEFRKFAEEYLLEQLEYDELPESEKRRIAAERRAQQLEDELKSRDEKSRKAEEERAKAEAYAEVDAEISEVLKELGRPANPYLVAAIVDQMIARYEASEGRERLPAKKALEMAQKRLESDLSAYLDDLPDEEIVKRLPPKKLEAIRKHFLSQVGMQSPKRQAPEQKPQQSKNDDQPKSVKSYFDDLDARYKRRKA